MKARLTGREKEREKREREERQTLPNWLQGLGPGLARSQEFLQASHTGIDICTSLNKSLDSLPNMKRKSMLNFE